MISIQLIIFLTFIYIVLFIILLYLIFNKILSVRDSLVWFSFLLLMILFSYSNNILKDLSTFLGIEIVSNMIFFFGFILLIGMSIFTSIYLSKQKNKITILVQEVALLKKKVEDLDVIRKNK